MIDFLQGLSAEWTLIDITDDQPADFFATLTPEELAELNIYGSSIRATAMRATENDRVKRSCLASLRDSLTHAELDGDEGMVNRLRMTHAAAEMMQEADDIVELIATLRADARE